MAVGRVDEGDVQVWIYDLVRGTQERLTREGLNWGPSWHPNGSRIAFTTLIRGNFDVREAPADGSGRTEDLAASDQDESTWRWSPDGRSALFEVQSAETSSDIWFADPSRPEVKRALLASPLRERDPEVSPDGKWVAYQLGDDLYVARYPDLAARSLVAQASRDARWSGASPELFYIKAGRLMSLRYEARPDSLRLLPPHPLFDVPPVVVSRPSFEVSADGSRFLFLVPVSGPHRREGIHVVLDGFAELRQPEAPASR